MVVALIAGLCAFGLRPRATLEIPGPTRRLDRILELISACRYSFHDLSRVQLSRDAPRFNMHFEVRLAVSTAPLPPLPPVVPPGGAPVQGPADPERSRRNRRLYPR